MNMWAGIMNNRIIGPVRLVNRLDADSYMEFLLNTLPDLLEQELTQQEMDRMIFQHDGAPAHTANATQELLHEMFPNGYIGRGGMIEWPARSPDFNPLDYYLWGKLKDIVYHNGGTFNNEEELTEQIIQAAHEIEPEEIARAVDHMQSNCDKCIEHEGEHFEQFQH